MKLSPRFTVIAYLIFFFMHPIRAEFKAISLRPLPSSRLNGTWVLSFGRNPQEKIEVYIFGSTDCPFFAYITPTQGKYPDLKEHLNLTEGKGIIEVFLSSPGGTDHTNVTLKEVNPSYFETKGPDSIGLVNLRRVNHFVPLKETITAIQSYIHFQKKSLYTPYRSIYHDNTIIYKSSITTDKQGNKKFLCYYFPLEIGNGNGFHTSYYTTYYVYSNGEVPEQNFPIPLRWGDDHTQALPGYFNIELTYSKDNLDKFDVLDSDKQKIGEFLVYPQYE